MKNLANYLGVVTLLFYSAVSHAQLIYSPDSLFDTATGNIWKRYTTIEAGLLNGFKPATVAQTAELFLSYAPLDSGGALPGYDPEVLGVTSMVTSEDGKYFSVDWESSYYYQRYNPPSLVDAFGYNVRFGGGGPSTDSINSLVTLVQDGDSWTPVLIHSTFASNQYGSAWGNELGVINPTGKYFRWDWDFHTYCPEFCYLVPGNPYLESSGELKLGGYLMISAVPELPPGIALFAGLMCLSLMVKNRKRRNLPITLP